MIRYVTRWALTSGIRKVDGEYTSGLRHFHDAGMGVFVNANETTETLRAAHAKAREMASREADRLEARMKSLRDPNWRAKVVE